MLRKDNLDYEKLNNLDYTAWDHASDFNDSLESLGIDADSLSFSSHYEDGTPVFDVYAENGFEDEGFTDSYELEGVSREEFEDLLNGVWRSAFNDAVLR